MAADGITDSLELFTDIAFSSFVEPREKTLERYQSKNFYSADGGHVGIYRKRLWLRKNEPLLCAELEEVTYGEWKNWALELLKKDPRISVPPITWRLASSPVFVASYRPRNAGSSKLFARMDVAVPSNSFDLSAIINLESGQFTAEAVRRVLDVYNLWYVPEHVLREKIILLESVKKCEGRDIYVLLVQKTE